MIPYTAVSLKTPAHCRTPILGRLLQTGACIACSMLLCVQPQARTSSHRWLPPLARPRSPAQLAGVEARMPWLPAAEGSQRCSCTAGKGQGSTCAADPNPEPHWASQGKQNLANHPRAAFRLSQQWPRDNLSGHPYSTNTGQHRAGTNSS